MSNQYKLTIALSKQEADQVAKQGGISVKSARDRQAEITYLQVESIAPVRSGFGHVINDLKKILKAIRFALQDRFARSRFLSIAMVYVFLTPSGISSFFVRGWRWNLIKNMIQGSRGKGLAPTVNDFSNIGTYIKEGIKLVSAKALYDIPKLLVLVAIGYDHFEFLLDWLDYFLSWFIDSSSSKAVGTVVDETSVKITKTLVTQLIFYAIYSLLVTPAFKLTEIRYAAGKVPYKAFFSCKELKESYRLYKKYRITTLNMYLWDALVSAASFLVGISLGVILPLYALVGHPFYKLMFKHLPKAYGYGTLARRLQANGDLPPPDNPIPTA